MQIIKVINNNVISSEDDKGKEIIVMGKGIGFGKKAGEEIDETKIEKQKAKYIHEEKAQKFSAAFCL